jgi:LCP family protein required for cell wall assembly
MPAARPGIWCILKPPNASHGERFMGVVSMNTRRAMGALALAIAMTAAFCLDAPATFAPAAAAEAAHDSGLSQEDQQLLENTFGDEKAGDEVLPEEDNDDAVVENPDEEEQFLTDLMNELDIDETNALEKVNGMTHILLVGIDARPGQKTGRSDTMMLLTIDAEHGSLKLTSFMRDLYVEIPGEKNNRLNAAYMFGGPELLIKTLKKNFGVKVNYYAAVNFSLLADLIDQIGGLEVNIESEEQLKYINLVIKEDNVVLKKAYPEQGIQTNDNLLTKTGTQLLNGRQAQAYARYRKGSSDFERTERQRDVILKAMEKVKGMSMMDLGKLALDNLDKVNTNLTVADILRLAPAAFQLKDAKVKQLRIPVDHAFEIKTISKMSVLVPSREKNVKALTKFLLK